MCLVFISHNITYIYVLCIHRLKARTQCNTKHAHPRESCGAGQSRFGGIIIIYCTYSYVEVCSVSICVCMCVRADRNWVTCAKFCFAQFNLTARAGMRTGILVGLGWLIKWNCACNFAVVFFYLFVAAKIVVCGSLEYSIIYCIKSNTCFVGFETIFKEHHRAAARESLDWRFPGLLCAAEMLLYRF